MPEEMEVPTEHLHEALEEKAMEARERWVSRVALSAAVLAVFAAIASLLAGHHANEAILEQLGSSDQWAYYQSKSIKAELLNSKDELLRAFSRPVNPNDVSKLADYKQEQAAIQTKAGQQARTAEQHLRRHNILSRSVTLFQISIALSAISVLSRRKALWLASLAMGLAGVGILMQGILASV